MHHLLAIKKSRLLTILLVSVLVSCCDRYDFVPTGSADLRFSSDTISFDTVFTPLGSSTFSCKVYNNSSQNLLIDEVKLAAGGASPFLMNVDGRAGYSVRNIHLAKKDSLFIFIEVQKLRELLLTDQIVFVTGGVEQASKIELVAYGQDVVLIIRDTVMRSDLTFSAEKPYIINANVTVDTGIKATVEAGAKLYFGRKCGMTVNGELVAIGQQANPCVFSHPRYNDPWYGTASGQWEGVTISATGKANLEYVHMQGPRYGLVVVDTLGEVGTNYPQLNLSKGSVTYAEVGIFNQNGSFIIDNTLITNCLSNALRLEGGAGQAYQCTFATYSMLNGEYHGPQVALQNFSVRALLDSVFYPSTIATLENSIIYGNNVNELSIQQRKASPMSYSFGYSIIKLSSSFDISDPNHFYKISKQDPRFKSIEKNDFHLGQGSPAINAGSTSTATSFPVDLDGYNRTAMQDSTMGCYVYHP